MAIYWDFPSTYLLPPRLRSQTSGKGPMLQECGEQERRLCDVILKTAEGHVYPLLSHKVTVLSKSRSPRPRPPQKLIVLHGLMTLLIGWDPSPARLGPLPRQAGSPVPQGLPWFPGLSSGWVRVM